NYQQKTASPFRRSDKKKASYFILIFCRYSSHTTRIESRYCTFVRLKVCFWSSPMKLDKFTQKSQEAIFQAQEIARDYNHQSIEPAHLLLALIRQQNGIVPALVTQVAGSVYAL